MPSVVDAAHSLQPTANARFGFQLDGDWISISVFLWQCSSEVHARTRIPKREGCFGFLFFRYEQQEVL